MHLYNFHHVWLCVCSCTTYCSFLLWLETSHKSNRQNIKKIITEMQLAFVHIATRFCLVNSFGFILHSIELAHIHSHKLSSLYCMLAITAVTPRITTKSSQFQNHSQILMTSSHSFYHIICADPNIQFIRCRNEFRSSCLVG